MAHTPNQSPIITTLTDGQTFTFEAGQGITTKIHVDATDADGDLIGIANTPLPPGAFYEVVEQFPGLTSASITFQDGRPFVGTYDVTFTAIDEHDLASTSVTITIVVIPPDYLDIENAGLEGNTNGVMMEVKVEGSIAPTIQRPPYGFAALTSDGNGLLAVATHAGILDSEDQTDPGDDSLHTHVVDVMSSSNCLNGIEVISASFESPGKLEVGDEEVKVSEALAASFGDFSGTIISFILTIEDGVICVNPVDSMNISIPPPVTGENVLVADAGVIDIGGTTELIQKLDTLSGASGTLTSLIVLEADGDLCGATGLPMGIPPSGELTFEYPTDFAIVITNGDGICDTMDIGVYTAESEVDAGADGVLVGTVEFETNFFVIPESPIGVAALMGSSLAALGGFMLLRRWSSENN